MWSGGGYTYTTLSDYSDTNSFESCDNGCGTTTYRCATGYTYSNGKCTKPTNCEANGKHTSVGSWASECAKNGGTPTKDTDGCFICKVVQTCAQKYSNSNGYKIVDSDGTCDTGYTKFYMGVKDDNGKSCYTCIPAKTKTCEDYGYITITQSNYNDYMKQCKTLTSVKPEANLQCYKCDNTVTPGGNDTCVTTATTGDVANGSTIYFYGSDLEYSASKNGTCIGSMTIKAECKVYHKVGDYNASKTVLVVNGYEAGCKTNGATGCSYTEYRFGNDVIVCSGCSPTVTCSHKWGGGSFKLTGVPLDTNAGTYN